MHKLLLKVKLNGGGNEGLSKCFSLYFEIYEWRKLTNTTSGKVQYAVPRILQQQRSFW